MSWNFNDLPHSAVKALSNINFASQLYFEQTSKINDKHAILFSWTCVRSKFSTVIFIYFSILMFSFELKFCLLVWTWQNAVWLGRIQIWTWQNDIVFWLYCIRIFELLCLCLFCNYIMTLMPPALNTETLVPFSVWSKLTEEWAAILVAGSQVSVVHFYIIRGINNM